MPQQRASARKKSDPPQPAPEVPEAPPEQSQTEPEPFDAVVVIRETAPDGGVQTKITTTGDVRATEVETILKLGVQGWQKQIGLVD